MRKIFLFLLGLFLLSSFAQAKPVRVYYTSSGEVRVINPMRGSKKPSETEQEWLARVFKQDTPVGAQFDDMDSSELPSSREYRNAWEKKSGGGIEINQTKKKKIEAANQIVVGHEDRIQVLEDKLGIAYNAAGTSGGGLSLGALAWAFYKRRKKKRTG